MSSRVLVISISLNPHPSWYGSHTVNHNSARGGRWRVTTGCAPSDPEAYLSRDWHFIAVVYTRLRETAFRHPAYVLSYYPGATSGVASTVSICELVGFIGLPLPSRLSRRDSYLRHASSTNRQPRGTMSHFVSPRQKKPCVSDAVLTREPNRQTIHFRQCFLNRKTEQGRVK